MDFFDRQDKAYRNTKLLVLYFITGVSLLVLTVYLAVLLVFTGAASTERFEGQTELALWNSRLFIGTAVVTLGIILCGSLFKVAELSQGGSAVATAMGGRLISPNTTDPDERKLMNIVEEMSLASGVPVPQVYVMDDENGINAFAAGHTTSDAAVAVTRGCMQILNRDELQGVIAHEFSHVLNGDMRLNLRLMGIVFGILCLTVIGRILLHTRGRKNPLPLLGLILIVVGWIGVLFGRLIQAAVSRQREFLADASAVQFTRNPLGISGALKKIGGLSMGSRMRAAHAEEASHMFFGNGMGQPLFGLMATHPPLTERIRAIDPAFDGQFPKVRYEQVERDIRGLAPEIAAFAEAMTATRSRPPSVPPPRMPPPVPASAILPNLGAPTTSQLRYAVELRDSFSPAVQTAAHDPLGAAALICGLLLSNDSAVRATQLQHLADASENIRAETERLLPHVQSVARNARLPLVDLAFPALRELSPRQYENFSRAVQALVEADGEIELFEYMLQKIVLRHLDPLFKGVRKPIIQYYAIRPLADDCALLLSTLAHVGHDDPAQAQSAFRRGAQLLGYQAQTELSYVHSDQCDLPQVDEALKRLNQAVPQIKKNLLNACAQTVAADGLIQENEAELLRAIAETLDCPIPPFVHPKAEANR